MKKIKRIKKWLPFICATLLLFGSCMTVCASSVCPLPDDDKYKYYVEITQKGENVPIKRIYTSTECFYMENIGVSFYGKYYYYVNYSDGEWGDTAILFNRGTTSNACCIAPDSQYDILYSNYDILYRNSDEVFFRPLLVTLARGVPGVVLKQATVILPIAVFCLALLIGSIVLLPRLKIFLLK